VCPRRTVASGTELSVRRWRVAVRHRLAVLREPSRAPDSIRSATAYAFIQTGVFGLFLLGQHFVLSSEGPDIAAMPVDEALRRASPIICFVLLLVGGVVFRSGWARWPLLLGCIVELAYCVYFTILIAWWMLDGAFAWPGAGIIFIALSWLLFGITPPVILFHALRPTATRYLRERRLSAPVVPPAPT